ncbi:MAG: hypothetical protein H0W64_09700 [Gammaproteobacteria bacterium]|nr:hypothetical protein [Gammaproteobacteria bacterium]
MAIKDQLRIISRVIDRTEALKIQYGHNKIALNELKKLKNNLTSLKQYLKNLDETNSTYKSNEVNELVKPLFLHLDILKIEMTANDYRKLSKALTGLKKLLHFHAKRYSTFQFICAWVLEFFYFI